MAPCSNTNSNTNCTLQQNKQPIDVEATQFEPWFDGGKGKKCKNVAFLMQTFQLAERLFFLLRPAPMAVENGVESHHKISENM